MNLRTHAAAAALGLALAATPGAAQELGGLLGGEAADPDEPVALVADSIEYDSEAGTVTATGNVEVYYGDRTLTAERIVYDSGTDRLSASGAIVLRDPDGSTVFAEAADLDVELYDGLVEGARSIIASSDDRGRPATARLAAAQARRVEGRYNVLDRAVYSPCDVCPDEPTPLWRLRARRVIHDEEDNVIYYEDATFDVFGVPVFYLPYFSHPDPTVERKSGFLVPGARQSGNYGFALRVPYYQVIDDQTDFTFQPLITTDDGIFPDLEFRREFATGSLFFRGSVGKTDFTGESRFQGHVDTDALFTLDDLQEGAVWGWDVKVASDDAYLRFFDISDEDRLASEAFLRNYREDFFYDLTGLYFQSLRNREPAGQIPRVLPDFRARQEVGEPYAGGALGFFVDTQSLFRNEGVDVTRLSLGVDWEREAVLDFGLALRGFAEARGDLFLRFEDAGIGEDGQAFRLAPLAGVDVRYPLIAEEADGDSHVVEPIAQLVLAPYGGNGPEFPNEDSQQTEFDTLNLFERSRFSGLDGVEEGPRLTLGLNYERFASDGLSFAASAGRVVRFAEIDSFGEGAGLDGRFSDWVASWRASYLTYASIEQRVRLDDDGSVGRNEVFGTGRYGPASLSVGYVFLEDQPLVEREGDREEVSAFASLDLTDEWRTQSFVRHDLDEDQLVAVGGALTYANECCRISAFVSRDFTDSEDVPASTSFGVEVELLTLGASDTGGGVFDAQRPVVDALEASAPLPGPAPGNDR